MSNPTESVSATLPLSPTDCELPPDLQALLACVERKSEERVGLVIPSGCGKMPLGLAYIRHRDIPCLLVAPDVRTAHLWADRYREECLERGDPASLSLHPLTPARLTVTDRATLASQDLRALIHALRTGGVRLLVVDEPYTLSAELPIVLTRLHEALPESRVLSLASRLPYDLTEAERARVESVCGTPVGAIGISSLVRRGVLCPHRDLVYLCEPPARSSEALTQAVEERLAILRRVATLPFLCRVGDRIRSLGRDYLWSHGREVAALTAYLRAYGFAGWEALARQLPPLPRLTADIAETALTYLLQSRAILSDREKEALHHAMTDTEASDISASGPEPETPRRTERPKGLFCRGDAWRASTAGAIKAGGVADILRAEEAALGVSLRMMIVADREPEAIFSTLHRRGDGTVVGLWGGTCLLPSAVADRLIRATREPIMRFPSPWAGYAECRPTEAGILPALLLQMFEEGEIRVILTDGAFSGDDVPGLGRMERLTNVLVLPSVTELRRDGHLIYRQAIADLRGHMLRTRRDEMGHARVVHIWHMATVAGDAHPIITEEVDESEAVRGFLRCVAGDSAFALADHVPLERAARQAHNAALGAATADRRATIRAFRPTPDESANHDPRMTVEVPLDARVPILSVGRVVGLVLSLLAMGIGGFLLPHLVALTLQARGMPAVMGIFMGLLSLAVGMLVGGAFFCLRTVPPIVCHCTPKASIRSLSGALLRAFRELDLMGKDTRVRVSAPRTDEELPRARRHLSVTVENATFAEADTFYRALAELLSPIDNPRYLLRRAGGRAKRHAKRGTVVFTCPDVLAHRDASVELLAACLSRSLGKVEPVYTRRDRGVLTLSHAQSYGYLGRAEHGSTCRVTG